MVRIPRESLGGGSFFSPVRHKATRSKRERLWRRDYKERLAQFDEEAKRGVSWRLNGAVVCERYPLVSPDMEDWEFEFQEWRQEKFNEVAIDINRDVDDVEVDDGLSKRQRKRKKNKERKDPNAREASASRGSSKPSEDKEFLDKQAEQEKLQADKEDLEEEEEFGAKMEELLADTLPRVTADDAANNRRSLNRALPHRLFLLLQDKASGKWNFPMGRWSEGQTMRECAESEFRKAVGDDLDAWVIGNAPSGHTKVHYNEPRDGFHGEKTFFYRAQYLGGELKYDDQLVNDFVWVTKDEISEYLEEDTYHALDPMLLHE